MNQDDINLAEWKNQNNWSFIFYHSAQDTRIFVPKRWGFGWTINLGNGKGAGLFAALMALPVIVIIVSLVLLLVIHRR